MFLALAGCMNHCIASPWEGGEVKYRIESGDGRAIYEATQYVERLSEGRVSFRLYDGELPDLVFRYNADICAKNLAGLMRKYQYPYVLIEICPGEWSNKSVVYVHEIFHAYDMWHKDSKECILFHSSKKELEACEEERLEFLQKVSQ